jgi:hypothetical protein
LRETMMPPGSASASKRRGHVDAVTVDIVVVADDIANIDANTELNAALGRHIGITLNHATLDVDGATHGVHDADEFDQHPIAGGLDDPTPVLRNFGINQFLAVGFQLLKGSLFVNTHQPAVTGSVGRQNRGKSTIYAVSNHANLAERSFPDHAPCDP